MQAVTLMALVGASQCLLLAMVSYLQSPTPRASDKILTAILVIEGIRLLSLTAVSAGAPEGPWLYPHPLRLAIGPLVMFYALYMVCTPASLNLRSSLHFTPAVLVTLALLLNNAGLYSVAREEWLRPIAMVEGLVFIYYGYTALRIITVYRDNLLQTHSAIENLNLGWIKWVCVYVTLMGAALVIGGIYLSLQPGVFNVSNGILFSTVTSLIFCYVISLKGIQQSRYFERQLVEDSAHPQADMAMRPLPEPAEVVAEKYHSSAMSKEEAEHFFALVVEVMERDKLFLRHRLKLADLARESGLHPQQLSQVINQCAHKHFYDFVNGYRVEEALRLMREEPSRGATILDVAAASGFNSPATFYKYFRKYTGKTPKTFLQQAAI